MMRRLPASLRRLWPLALGGAAVLSLGLAAHPTPARADATNGICIPSTLSYAPTWYPQCDASGNLKVTGTFTPSGTQNVNLTQVNGSTISLGQTTMSASLPVAIASNQTAIGITRPYNAANTQAAVSGTFVGAAGYDGTTVDALATTTSGVLKTQTCTASGGTCGSAANPADSFSTQPGTTTLGQNEAYNGTNWDRVRKDTYAAGPAWVTSGGAFTANIASGAGNTVVKNSAGRLAMLLITTGGSAALTCYDNASTNSGTIIGVTPTATTSGQTYVFNTPAVNGITCAGAVSSPVATASYF